MSYHHWIVVHWIQSLLFKCISVHPFWRLCSPALHHLKWHHQSLTCFWVFMDLPLPIFLAKPFLFWYMGSFTWSSVRTCHYIPKTLPWISSSTGDTIEFLSYAYLDLFFLLYTSNLNSHSFFLFMLSVQLHFRFFISLPCVCTYNFIKIDIPYQITTWVVGPSRCMPIIWVG